MQENNSLEQGAGADSPVSPPVVPPVDQSKIPGLRSEPADVSSVPPPPWTLFARWCLDRSRRLVHLIWKFVCDAASYYWSIRHALWEYVAGFAPNMMSEAVRMREVRLASYEAHPLVDYDSAGWRVAVPNVCVVCGEAARTPPVDENLAVDNAARACLIPLSTMLVTSVLGLILWSRWPLLLALPLGCGLGYLLREKISVRLRVMRCAKHTGRTNIPQVLVWGNTLVLRFGHKLVRKVFLYGEMAGTTVPLARGAVAGEWAPEPEAAPPYTPLTIPLADSPHPDISTIRHSQPPVFGSDDDNSSAMVP